EDNRNLTITGRQLTLKLEPIHPRHAYIEYQAVRITEMIRIQELFGRSKYLHCEPDRPDYTPKGFTDGVIIVDNRNKKEISHADLSIIQFSNISDKKSIILWYRWLTSLKFHRPLL